MFERAAIERCSSPAGIPPERSKATQKENSADTCKHDASTTRAFQLKHSPFRSMETIEEEEGIGALIKRMYSKMIDARLRFSDNYDKGTATVTPYYWQSLVYLRDLVLSVHRDEWAPKRF